MSSAFVLLFLIFGQMLLLTSNGVQGKQYFGIGRRQEGDSLVLKDILSSRPAGISEPPRVAFTYNITEPITYIEFTSEEVSLSMHDFGFWFSHIQRPPKQKQKICFFRHHNNNKRGIYKCRYVFIHLYLVHMSVAYSLSNVHCLVCLDDQLRR